MTNLNEIKSTMFKAFFEQTETSVVCCFETGEKTIYSAKPIYNQDGAFVGMLAVISPYK